MSKSTGSFYIHRLGLREHWYQRPQVWRLHTDRDPKSAKIGKNQKKLVLNLGLCGSKSSGVWRAILPCGPSSTSPQDNTLAHSMPWILPAPSFFISPYIPGPLAASLRPAPRDGGCSILITMAGRPLYGCNLVPLWSRQV